ncbi:MAG: extracellular solute-binding protein [Pusillimonas sp.]
MVNNIQRRKLLKSSAAVGALALVGSLAAPAVVRARSLKGEGEVVIYDGGGAWGEAQRIAYFEPFEKETGIRVIRNPRSDIGAVRASIAAGSPRYDATILPGGNITSFVSEGLLESIDYSLFEKTDLDAFDPIRTEEFACPHIIYSLIVAYRKSKFPNGGPKNWADLWNIDGFPGRRALASGVQHATGATFENALLADGVRPEDLYPLDWDRAFRSLTKIKKDIFKWWFSGAESVQLLIDDQVALCSAWNGRISSAIAEGADLEISWDQGVLQTDYWTVLKGAKNKENAMRFLAFSARADRQAEFATHILYSPPNSRAFDYISKERAEHLPTQPAVRNLQIPQNYEFWGQKTNGISNDRYAVAQWEAWVAGLR